MLPSSTVENYLKAIYLGGASQSTSDRLLPTTPEGQAMMETVFQPYEKVFLD